MPRRDEKSSQDENGAENMESVNPITAAPIPPKQAAEAGSPQLRTLEALEAEFRVPGWQAAALRRMMHWDSGKQVDAQSYGAALEQLKKRPLGAGA